MRRWIWIETGGGGKKVGRIETKDSGVGWTLEKDRKKEECIECMSVFANSASLFMFRFFRVERLSLSAAVGRVSQRRMRLFSWMALKSFSKVSNRTALSSDAPLEDSTETCSLLQRYESPNNKECTMQGSGIKFVTKIASLLVIMVRRIFHKLG